MPNSDVITFAGAVAWGAIWVNLVVLYFFGKGEKLHQDYKEKGSLDAGLAAIESRRLIPALARIFHRARDAQEDQRKKIDMTALLQDENFDFGPDREELEAAMQQKRTLLDCYKLL